VQGRAPNIDADLRDPGTILDSAAKTLDFGKPVAVMFLASIHFVADLGEASAIVKQLMDACAPGSYLAIAHPASDIAAEQVAEMVRRLNETTQQKTTLRDHASVARLFEGYDLVELGVVCAPEWRPRSEVEAASPAALWAGVARKR
jgi:hypothetical protein